MLIGTNQFDAPQPLGRGLLMIMILSGAYTIRALKGADLAPSKYKPGACYVQLLLLTAIHLPQGPRLKGEHFFIFSQPIPIGYRIR